MRACYGSGKHWYVVAQPFEADGVAYGWSEDALAWERLGAERVDWKAGEFGTMIEFDRIPQDVRDKLPKKLRA